MGALRLSSLELTNYRGFDEHIAPFDPSLTVIVGANNAGKSTLIEALRLIALAIAAGSRQGYKHRPTWAASDVAEREGVHFKLRELDFNLDTMGFQYSEPPSVVTAKFGPHAAIAVAVHPVEGAFAAFRDNTGRMVTSAGAFRRSGFPDIAVLSHLGHLQREERQLTLDHVRRNLGTSLSPRHFRNQLIYFGERTYDLDDWIDDSSPSNYERFVQLAEATWPGLHIEELAASDEVNPTERQLSLLVRDGGFVGEIGWMGNGLQMWLQTIWFVARAHPDSLVVLDEPDIYMHPTMQHSVLDLVRQRFPQAVVSTHSMELIGEVPLGNILMLDRREESSHLVSSLPEIDTIATQLGSNHNLEVARLLLANRCLIVEGEDAKPLRTLARRLFPGSAAPLDSVPSIPTGGWGGWEWAKHWARRLRESSSGLLVYCIFDRDYALDSEVAARLQEATGLGIALHVWTRKELENYFLDPPMVHSALMNMPIQPGGRVPALEELSAKILSITDDLLEDLVFDRAEAHRRVDRGISVKTAMRRAQLEVAASWETLDQRLAFVPAKALASPLFGWLQDECMMHMSFTAIVQNANLNTLDPEIRAVLEAIEASAAFVQ